MIKMLNKNSIHGELYRTIISVITLAVSVISPLLGLMLPATSLAATSPSLGVADSYGIVSDTFTNSLNAGLETKIVGDVCYTTPPGTAPISISGATVVPCSSAVGTAQSSALANLNAQTVGCTNLGTNVVLSGTYTPGCYTSSGTMDITLSTTVTLSGAGTYIFRPGGALTTGANSSVVLTNGASACDVFWTLGGGAATIGANSSTSSTPTFVGNIIVDALSSYGINLGHFVNLLGRALAFGHTVTTDSNTITVPTCSVASTSTPSPSGSNRGTINVVKTVINDNGGTKVASDFPLFINGQLVISGQTNTFSAPGPVFTVTETGDANYARSFSGDCDVNGQLNLIGGQNKFCIVTNDDIGPAPVVPVVPPLIDVVKVPNPLALPGGSGPVTYTYTLRNIGTVPVTDITMVGDTCSPIVLVSGDTNNDAKMDVNETWIHRCTTTLTETHTNNVVATGWANGISAVDIASSTVIVGQPVVPPLIHIVKRPSNFILPVSGPVTYTFTVTNPGTVALSNVSVYDNKCSPASSHSGDINTNNMLDVSETWVYSCQTNLASNTVNTATATGMANGLIATDFSVATVLVTPPGFPNTGAAPDQKGISLNILTLAGVFVASVCYYFIRRKQTI